MLLLYDMYICCISFGLSSHLLSLLYHIALSRMSFSYIQSLLEPATFDLMIMLARKW